jgi:predicted dehydrogenase
MAKSVGVLGSGFGLYGYLPALNSLGYKIHVLEKYRLGPILNRPELQNITPDLNFHSEEDSLLESIDYLVICRRPQDQVDLLSKLQNFNSIEYLFLEKPLAPNVNTHVACADYLAKRNLPFSVGYLFLYTDWYAQIEKLIKHNDNLLVKVFWKIPKPKGWKLSSHSGGGIFEYYLIHFLPLFSNEFEYLSFEIENYTTELVVVNLFFETNSKRNLRLQVSFGFNSSSLFSVDLIFKNRSLYEHISTSPFAKGVSCTLCDERVPNLVKYISSMLEVFSRNGSAEIVSKSLKLENRVIGFRQQLIALPQPNISI